MLVLGAVAWAEEAVNVEEEGLAEKQEEDKIKTGVGEVVSAVLELDSDDFEAALKGHPLLLVGHLPHGHDCPGGVLCTVVPALPGARTRV